VVALDEGFKRKVSTFNIVYGSKTMRRWSCSAKLSSHHWRTVQMLSV
jgi:hypothetical protein